MQAVKITDKVYWVGAIDWNIRDFHGYSTKKAPPIMHFWYWVKNPL